VLDLESEQARKERRKNEKNENLTADFDSSFRLFFLFTSWHPLLTLDKTHADVDEKLGSIIIPMGNCMRLSCEMLEFTSALPLQPPASPNTETWNQEAILGRTFDSDISVIT